MINRANWARFGTRASAIRAVMQLCHKSVGCSIRSTEVQLFIHLKYSTEIIEFRTPIINLLTVLCFHKLCWNLEMKQILFNRIEIRVRYQYQENIMKNIMKNKSIGKEQQEGDLPEQKKYVKEMEERIQLRFNALISFYKSIEKLNESGSVPQFQMEKIKKELQIAAFKQERISILKLTSQAENEIYEMQRQIFKTLNNLERAYSKCEQILLDAKLSKTEVIVVLQKVQQKIDKNKADLNRLDQLVNRTKQFTEY